HRLARPVLLGALLATPGASAQDMSPRITGSVSVAGSDGARVLLPGVTVTLTCAGADPRTEISDEQGEFRFADVRVTAATCWVAADLQGFRSTVTPVAINAGETTMVSLELGLDTLREEVTVHGTATPAEGPAGARV